MKAHRNALDDEQVRRILEMALPRGPTGRYRISGAEIARREGVSVSTVKDVVNGSVHARVSRGQQETRQ